MAAVRQARMRTVEVPAARRQVARRRCPACGDIATKRSNWGITGEAYVCRKCLTSTPV